MSNMTVGEEKCVGSIMWLDQDMGRKVPKRILTTLMPYFDKKEKTIAYSVEFSIETAVYGLSQEELIEEISGLEYVLNTVSE